MHTFFHFPLLPIVCVGRASTWRLNYFSRNRSRHFAFLFFFFVGSAESPDRCSICWPALTCRAKSSIIEIIKGQQHVKPCSWPPWTSRLLPKSLTLTASAERASRFLSSLAHFENQRCRIRSTGGGRGWMFVIFFPKII